MTEIVTIGNNVINHDRFGTGQPIVLLHGWGANIELLRPLAECLARLNYEIFMPDLPGFGKSDDPPVAWTIFDYANLCITYLDHFQLHQVFLFGHSFGGRLGLILGSAHASRIKKMTLSDSAGIITPTPLAKQLRLSTYKSIRDGLYAIGAKSIADNLRETYNKRYGSTDYQQVSGIMRETFVNVVNQDLLPHADYVNVPTILIWGDQDEDTPLWQGKKLEQAIKDAALIVYEGAGHYAYLEQPERTARIMDALFRSDESG